MKIRVASIYASDSEYEDPNQITYGENIDNDEEMVESGYDLSEDSDDEERFVWQPCPTCSPHNRWGYVCPNPVPPRGQPISEASRIGHYFCEFTCNKILPRRNLPQEKCAGCHREGGCNLYPDGLCDGGRFLTFEGQLKI